LNKTSKFSQVEEEIRLKVKKKCSPKDDHSTVKKYFENV